MQVGYPHDACRRDLAMFLTGTLLNVATVLVGTVFAGSPGVPFCCAT